MDNDTPEAPKTIKIPPPTDEQREYLEGLLKPQVIDMDYVVGGPSKPRDPKLSP